MRYEIIVSVLWLSGCTPPLLYSDPWPATELNRLEVLEIARQTIAAHDPDITNVAFRAGRRADGWDVLAWVVAGYDSSGLPRFLPDRYIAVSIDNSGVVIDYRREAGEPPEPYY